MALTIDSTKTPEGPFLLHPAGDLEGDDAGELLQRLRAAVEDGERVIVIDLADVDFIDSQGLAVILQARKVLKDLGGKVRLARPHPAHRRLLSITRIDRLIETPDSLTEALAA